MSRVVSSLPGRIRIRDKTLRSRARLALVEAELRRVEGVAIIEPNAVAGSIVLHYAPDRIDPVRLENEVDALIDMALAAPQRPAGARSLRMQVNRCAKIGMMGSLATSLALAAAGNKRWHAATGVVFVACLGVHLGVHRRHLLR
ncbi:HMA2 domain-containing protein [Pseudorhodoferax sp.]|uniref:HMA2 domain-containing protein n=1 Tax=Pseudorhodoferax sp. TaxID=1993553 RepID=UPI0039E5F720